MICKLIHLFACTLTLAIVQERLPAKLPEYIQRPKQEIRQREENINRAKQQVATNPGSAEAYFELGEAYKNAESHRAELAAEAYKRAVLLKPDYAQAYKGLAWAYGTLKQYGKQVEALEQAIKLNPNDAEAYCKLGDAHKTFDIGRQVPPLPSEAEVMTAIDEHKKKAELAAEAYEKAIKIKPDYSEAYGGLGSVYLFLQRHREAIEAYNRAIEYDPTNPLMCIGLGYVYLDLSEYKEALEQHKAAMQLIENVKEPSLRGIYELGARLLLSRIEGRMKEKQQR